MVALLDAYLARFEVAPQFDAGDVAHYLLPIPGVVHSYVVEADGAPPLHTLPKRRASLCARAPSRLAVGRTVTDAGSARRLVLTCAGCPGTPASPLNRQACSQCV